VISTKREILDILDRCCESFTFPMLDNGYVYLAATRLSLFRSDEDWAMVIEVFGFSPRAGMPDICVHTFASTLWERDRPESYVDRKSYDNYLARKPNNEARFFFPIEEGGWQDSEDPEFMAQDATEVKVRGRLVSIPTAAQYASVGIELEQNPRAQVFELCRYLAETSRNSVLATPEERRVSVRPEMEQILQLEEWHHPNLVAGETASDSETFQRLAEVLTTADPSQYKPTRGANTHWRNWPDGGRL